MKYQFAMYFQDSRKYGSYDPYVAQHRSKYGSYDPYIAQHRSKYGSYDPYMAQHILRRKYGSYGQKKSTYWESFIPILEILEIEVCNILYNPGNIGKRFFWFSPILEILEIWFFQFSHILEILEICVFHILWFFPKRRAPKFHAECTGQWAEISHMRPIQAWKLKLIKLYFWDVAY